MWKRFFDKVAEIFYTDEKLDSTLYCDNDECNCDNQCDDGCKCCK